jgi:RNA polymerase sigma-B factor
VSPRIVPVRPAGDDEWLTAAFVRLESGDDANVRSEIAIRLGWLAERCARRFWDAGEPHDDLVQVAQIGLLHAIDRFDMSIGVPFGAFATPTIMGELRRHFRDRTWSVYVPRRAKDVRTAVNAMRDALARELGRSPRPAEIAERLALPEDRVIEALEANNAYRSRTLDDSLHARPADDGGFETVISREQIEGLLDHLPERQRRILVLRFFEDMSQEQIAQVVGTSQVHVGRLITVSLAALRRIAEADAATDDV